MSKLTTNNQELKNKKEEEKRKQEKENKEKQNSQSNNIAQNIIEIFDKDPQLRNWVRKLENVPRKDVKGSIHKYRNEKHEPLQIIIQTGKYAGLTFDLGTNIYELSVTQKAEWSENKEQGIKTGMMFSKISPREISFSIDYFLDTDDVSQLVENWAALQEISYLSNNTRTPPLLVLIIGSQIYKNTVLLSIDFKYDNPFPGNKGFKHCTVSLSFASFGGMGSIYQLAPPHAPCSLLADALKETELERKIREMATIITSSLRDCIGNKANTVERILKEGGYNNPERWLSITDPETVSQLAIGGLLTEAARNNTSLQQRIKESIAHTIAQNNVSPAEAAILVRALVSGNPPPDLPGTRLNRVIPGEGVTLYEKLKAVYDDTVQGVLNGNLNAVISNSNNTFLQQVLSHPGVGGCGLSLLQMNFAGNFASSQSQNSRNVNMINKALSSLSDSTLSLAFGLSSNPLRNQIISFIKSRTPFSSKEEFMQAFSNSTLGFSGYSAWSNFESWINSSVSSVREFVSSNSVEEIKNKFNISQEKATVIKNSSISLDFLIRELGEEKTLLVFSTLAGRE